MGLKEFIIEKIALREATKMFKKFEKFMEGKKTISGGLALALISVYDILQTYCSGNIESCDLGFQVPKFVYPILGMFIIWARQQANKTKPE